jgi:hypothetical protein
MRERLALFVPVLLGGLLLAACTGAADLKGPDRTVPADASAALRRKADEALTEAKYADAWNLEAQAGSDRARLEAIAVASLDADNGPYEDMMKALRGKFGGLSADARSRVSAVTKKFEADRKWTDAAEVEIVTADDAPAYQGAWGVYTRTPVKDALDVYQRIEKARKALEDDAADAAKNDTSRKVTK